MPGGRIDRDGVSAIPCRERVPQQAAMQWRYRALNTWRRLSPNRLRCPLALPAKADALNPEAALAELLQASDRRARLSGALSWREPARIGQARSTPAMACRPPSAQPAGGATLAQQQAPGSPPARVAAGNWPGRVPSSGVRDRQSSQPWAATAAVAAGDRVGQPAEVTPLPGRTGWGRDAFPAWVPSTTHRQHGRAAAGATARHQVGLQCRRSGNWPGKAFQCARDRHLRLPWTAWRRRSTGEAPDLACDCRRSAAGSAAERPAMGADSAIHAAMDGEACGTAAGYRVGLAGSQKAGSLVGQSSAQRWARLTIRHDHGRQLRHVTAGTGLACSVTAAG